MGSELFAQADGIDAIVGLGRRQAIAEIIRKTLSTDKTAAYLGHSCTKISKERPKPQKERLPIFDDRVRLLINPAHWAYLRISEGCDHRCSFCTIPAIRGRFRSKHPQLVLAEAAELVSAGVVELNVIAQDTTCYGRDLKTENALTCLLEQLEQIPYLQWLRLMYSYPTGINDKLVQTIAHSQKIVPYIDMPIQHINNQILNAMHRPDTKQNICSLIEKLRSAIPHIVLRTTLIIGFPGETDPQFNELLSFIKWAQFDALGCFKFYPESGTPAAEMPGQIPDKVKRQRLEELMLTQQRIAFARNKKRIGTKLTCLVDSVDPGGTGQGRFYGQAPDIDSVCIIEDCSANPGQFVNTKVTRTKDYDLIVRQI
jgi:ribosomal protein S12 methylthiotransferase